MNRRRLSAIALLKRLKKYEMEKDARELGELRHRMATLERQRQELAEGMRFKTPSYDANFTPYMQQFIPAAKVEIGMIAEQMVQIKPNITNMENRVSQKFQQFKTFDIIHNSLSAQMRDEQEMRENAEIEETVLWRWTQKKRAKMQQAKQTLDKIQEG